MIPGYRPSWMSDELDTLSDVVRRFAEKELIPNDDKWRKQHRVDREAWEKSGALGLLLADVPETCGGAGSHFGHEAVIYRELIAAGDNAYTMGRAVHAIVARYLLDCGTEAQKHKWLPGMARGEIVGAIAMTEPGTGSDLQGVRTRAAKRGNEFIINGAKTFISNGANAGLIIVVAKTGADQGSKGMSLILLDPSNTPGFRLGRVLEKIGMDGQDTCELFFDECAVPAENVLGLAEGAGFVQLMQQLPYERTIISVIASASIERALNLTVDYTRQRRAFGQALIEFQNTRFTLAEVKTMATMGRVFIDFLVERAIVGTLDTVTASMGKWWSTEEQCRAVDRCLQLFGGYGYMWEYPIARMYADARVQKIYGGANEIMKELIARSL